MNAPEPMDHCPNEETLAAFVDGRLDPEARRKVVEHMATCADCRSTVLTVAEFAAQSDAPATSGGGSVARFSPRFYFSAAAALAAAAVVIVLFGPMIRERVFPPQTGIEALVEATEPLTYRRVEGRLTGGFTYKSEAPRHRGPNEQQDEWMLVATAARIQAEHARATSVTDHHVVGVALLLIGKPQEAVEQLEEAISRDTGFSTVQAAIGASNDVELLTDLAAGYLERGRSASRPRDYHTAVSAANRALLINSTSPEALFNRALAIEKSQPRAQAIKAWQEYLDVDPSSEWSADATKHLELLKSHARISGDDTEDRLRKAATSRNDTELLDATRLNVQAASVFVEDEVLPDWGRAVLRGDSHAAGSALKLAHGIATAIAETTGDRLLLDEVALIDGPEQYTSANLRRLAEAHDAYGTGRVEFRNEHVASALRRFQEANSLFAFCHSPFQLRSIRYIATVQYYNGQPTACLEIARDGLESRYADPERYPGAVAQLWWGVALPELILGRPYEALQHYEKALLAFERAQQLDSMAAIHALMAECLTNLGDTEAAWTHRAKAIEFSSDVSDSQRLYPILTEAAHAALSEDLVSSALMYQEHLVSRLKEKGNSVLRCDAMVTRGRILLRAQQFDAAAASLAEARAEAMNIPDAVRRERAAVEVDIVAALLEADRNPTAADHLLSRAITVLERSVNRYRLPELYLARARIRLAKGADELSEADLAAGIESLEEVRLGITDPYRRSEFFSQSDDLFGEMIDLLWRQEQYIPALEYEERSRARTLLDLIGSRADGRRVLLDVAGLSRGMPLGATAIVFHAYEGSMRVWIVDKRGFKSVETPLDMRRLAMQMAVFNDDAASPESMRTALQYMYDVLVRPFLSRLASTQTLVIVPPKSLDDVPYSALLDRATGRHLVESYGIIVAPSLNVFVRHSQLERPEHMRALIVGSNTSGASEGLAALPEVETEVDAVAAHYPGAVILRGASATTAMFKTHSIGATLVHFGGHAVINERFPRYSSIRFVGNGDAGEPLYAHEIASLDFAAASCVVLSACRAIARRQQNESQMSLAEAFLAAGTRTVIAATRPVEDTFAMRFTSDLHRNIARLGSPVLALRKTQVEHIKKSDVRQWSSWSCVGGAS